MARKYNSEITFDIVANIATLPSGKEVNYVKWGEGEPKIDIRSWYRKSEDDVRPNKGICLSNEDALALYDILGQILEVSDVKEETEQEEAETEQEEVETEDEEEDTPTPPDFTALQKEMEKMFGDTIKKTAISTSGIYGCVAEMPNSYKGKLRFVKARMQKVGITVWEKEKKDENELIIYGQYK